MPNKRFLERLVLKVLWEVSQTVPMIWVISSPILEFLLEAATDLDSVLRRDCNIPAIEEAVEIASEEDAVIHRVRAVLIVWSDMGSLERRERMLLSDRTGAAVGVRNKYSECSLPQSRLYRCFFTVARTFLFDPFGFFIEAKYTSVPPRAFQIIPN